MSIAEVVFEKVKALPPAEQEKVLTYVQSLGQGKQPGIQRKNPCGMFSHLNISISKEEIDEARREMWKNFPRDLPEQ